MDQFDTPSSKPERWLPIPGWEGLYEVSDLGRIRSLTRRTPVGIRRGRVLKPFPAGAGRLGVILSANGRRANGRVSVLVALAFFGTRPPGMVVCHNDGNLVNNKASNLRYDTQSSNLLDKQIHGTDHQRNKTHCPKGHAYDGSNTGYGFGERSTHRVCRICLSAKGKRQREKEKALQGKEPEQHGTFRGYAIFKCRCDLCRAAGVAARRRYKENRLKREAA
jgi:hypothetical protein